MDDDLTARLERLELLEQGREATVRYGRAVDHRDLDELRDVFSADVVLHLPNAQHRGIDAVIGFYAGALADQPGTRRHFVTNQIATTRGPGEVEVDSYFFFVSADARSVIGWGAYHDIVTIVDGTARISDKTIGLDVFTDLDTGWADATLAEEHA